jgi:hypothetical protein
MDIIQQLTGIPLCPELAKQITVHLDKLDHIMLYFVNKQLQMSSKIVFGTLDSDMFTICNEAAALGYVNILKWAKNHSYNLGVGLICDIAAKHGHINVLSWARDKGWWCARTCASAAEGNQLDTLIWLRSNGCPWNTWTCWTAVDKGNLKMLEWIRYNGCPWFDTTRQRAAKLGYTDNYPLSGRQIN